MIIMFTVIITRIIIMINMIQTYMKHLGHYFRQDFLPIDAPHPNMHNSGTGLALFVAEINRGHGRITTQLDGIPFNGTCLYGQIGEMKMGA